MRPTPRRASNGGRVLRPAVVARDEDASIIAPMTEHTTTIAEARALVSRMEGGLFGGGRIKANPLLNPTRPETPSVNRRSSFPSPPSSHSSSRSSSVILASLPPSAYPGRPMSHERATLSRASPHSGLDSTDDGLDGDAEWKELLQSSRPSTSHVAEEMALPAEVEAVTEKAAAAALSPPPAAEPSSPSPPPATSKSPSPPRSPSPPVLLPDRAPQDEKEAAVAEDATAVPPQEPQPSAPSQSQLEDAVANVAYLCGRCSEDADALSPSALTHLYSLATSTAQHLHSPAHIVALATAFLPLVPATSHHAALHSAVLPLLLESLFALSHSPAHDAALLPALTSLARALGEAPMQALLSSPHQLMLLLSLLYNTSANTAAASALLHPHLLAFLSSALRLRPPSQAVVTDVLAVLRNLACVGAGAQVVVEAGLLTTALGVLGEWKGVAPVALGAMRLAAKLSLHQEGRAEMGAQVEAVEAMVHLLHLHHNKLALCIRVAFTLGNLTMANNDVRYVIADALLPSPSPTSGLNLLLSLFHRTLTRLSRLRSPASPALSPPRHAGLHREVVDLLTKLIRLLANLAIHGDVGERLASSADLAALLPLAGGEEGGEAGELALNSLACLSNLSYYQAGAAFIGHPVPAVVAALCPMLCAEQSPLLPQLLLTVANLTRSGRGGEALRTGRGLEAVLLLLEHGDGEVVEGVLGVLINATGEEEGRAEVLWQGGEWVRAMVGVGERGREVEGGWSLRVLVGKVLCNLRGSAGWKALEEGMRGEVAAAMGRWREELAEEGGVGEKEEVEVERILTAVYDAC